MSMTSATHFDSLYPDPMTTVAGAACSSMGDRFSRRETAAMELRKFGQSATQDKVNQLAEIRGADFGGELSQVEIYPLRCKETATNVHVGPRGQIRDKASVLAH